MRVPMEPCAWKNAVCLTGAIQETPAEGERTTRAGDESRFIDTHARVQRLERRQRDAQVGRLRLGRQLDHGQVDARGPERVLHGAGRQPQGSVASDNDRDGGRRRS